MIHLKLNVTHLCLANEKNFSKDGTVESFQVFLLNIEYLDIQYLGLCFL